jgi:hypothetical protein
MVPLHDSLTFTFAAVANRRVILYKSIMFSAQEPR